MSDEVLICAPWVMSLVWLVARVLQRYSPPYTMSSAMPICSLSPPYLLERSLSSHYLWTNQVG